MKDETTKLKVQNRIAFVGIIYGNWSPTSFGVPEKVVIPVLKGTLYSPGAGGELLILGRRLLLPGSEMACLAHLLNRVSLSSVHVPLVARRESLLFKSFSWGVINCGECRRLPIPGAVCLSEASKDTHKKNHPGRLIFSARQLQYNRYRIGWCHLLLFGMTSPAGVWSLLVSLTLTEETGTEQTDLPLSLRTDSRQCVKLTTDGLSLLWSYDILCTKQGDRQTCSIYSNTVKKKHNHTHINPNQIELGHCRHQCKVNRLSGISGAVKNLGMRPSRALFLMFL